VTAATRPRRLRSDAQRNHQVILETARDLFAATGSQVEIKEIARQAGVGVGTVCRHFPTKDELIGAVLAEMQQDILDQVRAALTEPDAGAAFRGTLEALTDLPSRNRLFAELIADGRKHLADPELIGQFHAAIDDLMRRAQDAGAIRRDVGPADIAMLLAGIMQAASMADELDADQRGRYLAIVWDGLRPLEPTPLPGKPRQMNRSAS